MESTKNVSIRKKTKGKQKIEMKKVENENSRIITFSKRKSGINKKLSELVTLCGAQVAFVAFSLSGKPCTFAHPSVETVINRYSGRNNDNDLDPQTRNLIEAGRQIRINELVKQYNVLQNRLDNEQQREKTLKSEGKKRPKGWWEAPIDEINLEELELRYEFFKDLHENALKMMSERNAVAAATLGASSSSSAPVMNPMAPDTNPIAPNSGDTYLETNLFGLDATIFSPSNNFVTPNFYGNDNLTMDFSIPIDATRSTEPAMDFSVAGATLGGAPHMDFSGLAAVCMSDGLVNDFPAVVEANRSPGAPSNVEFAQSSFGFGGNMQF